MLHLILTCPLPPARKDFLEQHVNISQDIHIALLPDVVCAKALLDLDLALWTHWFPFVFGSQNRLPCKQTSLRQHDQHEVN